jgi:hypothetical protein
MNWDAVGAVGEILGALGVIVSLAYLALQIRKSDQTARAESLQALWDGARDRSFNPQFADPEIGDLFAKGLTDFDSLSKSEKRRFQWLFTEHIFQAQQAYDLFQSNLIEEVDYQAWIYYTSTLLQTPGGTAVWRYVENTITPTIKNVLNQFLVDNPNTPSWIELNPFFNETIGED